jgi:hypothetical protein
MSAVERNREFLNFFWDLASDESEKRLNAGANVIKYLQNGQQ